MKKVLNLTYASSLTGLCEVNSSFDSGILRIAYAGENRNGSFIDKATFERCIKTIYNCPIVCNYDRDTDTLGGHDMEIVRDNEGELRLINVTTPVGCIPESARVFWEKIEEDDGTEHEYLCAEALIWKRQEAYQKIKNDGCSSQSMEISVLDGEYKDGIYRIYDFEFTAFALIGVEPCFESASLAFSKQDFKQQFSQMMLEIKECFTKVNPSSEDDIHPQNTITEGGERALSDNVEFAATVENAEIETNNEINRDPVEVSEVTHENDESFALEGDIRNELARTLESEKVESEWGEYSRYWFVDYDKDACEVYCWDTSDWLLYGFNYEMNGDTFKIFECSKKRKKYAIVDFDEGEQESPFAQLFAAMSEKIKSNTELDAKYQTASSMVASMEKELAELREFKAEVETTELECKRNEIFDLFNDLDGVEAFEHLKETCEEYDLESLEEKCFAIRGRNGAMKFTKEQSKAPKLPIERNDVVDMAYGGLFEKYGVEAEK